MLHHDRQGILVAALGLLAATCGGSTAERRGGLGGAAGAEEEGGTGGASTGGATGTGGAKSSPPGTGGAPVSVAPDAAADSAAPTTTTTTTPDAGAPAPGDAAGPPAAPGGAPAGYTLRWSAKAATTGMAAFEGQETAECTHAGTQHFGIADGRYRIDMHFPADTDCKAGDRQRNEVKGMANPAGGYIAMKKGETWLLQYSMFIPDTLDATSGFSHIHQIFATAGTMAVTGPVVTMSLHDHDGTPSIELRIDGTSGPHWSPVPLAPIQNKWVTVELETKWDNPGSYRWTIKDGERVHVNASRPWNGWHGSERMRPKWGIYRKRDSAGLQNTYILFDDLRAYQKD